MTKNQKILAAGIVIAIVIASLLVLGGHKNGNVGAIAPSDLAASNFTEVTASNGLAVGTSQQFQISSAGAVTLGASGTAVANLAIGTCYIRPRATTIVASSTAIVECQGTAAIGTPYTVLGGTQTALTGVASGDFVQVQLATTTAMGGSAGSQNLGLVIIGATASSTQGFIQLLIANNTGGTFTWPTTGSASGTASFISSR